MSILSAFDTGWIISHQKFFEKVNVTTPGIKPIDKSDVDDHIEKTSSCLSLNPDLFEITEPFRDKVKGKFVKNCANVDLSDTSKLVKALSDGILNDPQSLKIFERNAAVAEDRENVKDNDVNRKTEESKETFGEKGKWPKNNLKAVQASQSFFNTVKSVELPNFYGENPIQDSAVISTLPLAQSPGQVKDDLSNHHHQFVFPANTKFYCNDVKNMEKVFLEHDEKEFDLIVMDPPWWNKFIRRRKRKQHEAGYAMIDDDGIADLPISKILNADGIVIVWCTNAKSHQDKLINEIFPRWGVQHQRTLFWLKVTKSGIPVCPFNGENKKQPYETIIIGIKKTESTHFQFEKASETSKIIISVPSSINSHKPPLIEIIKKMFPHNAFNRKLEIFARYLIPGFTSYGNEVVKLQHDSLFIHTSVKN